MKRSFRVYRLKFRSPVHIGIDAPDKEGVLNFIHSDTILGAIYALAVKIDPGFCNDILNKKIKISSVFPFSFKKGLQYFMPKPALSDEFIFDIPSEDYVMRKKLKKLKFIPLRWFERILNGQKIKTNQDEVKNTKKVLKKAIQSQTVPRITLDRLSQNSNLFHYSELHFKKAGLYFLAEFNDKETQTQFEGLLNLLGDEGLGAKRSAGYGLFKVEKDCLELEVPDKSEHYILLSLYWPDESERKNLNLKDCFYQMTRRAGWSLLDDGRSFRKKPVWIIEEGTILKTKPEGGIVDVTPNAIHDKTVYRFGLAFSLPFKFANTN